MPRGFLSLMPLSDMGHKIQANFYAGLKEIQYLNSQYRNVPIELGDLKITLDKAPFDTVFLLDTLNQAGRNIPSVKQLHSMIATELCTEIYSSITREVESMLINAPPINTHHHKPCFYGSFATAALRVPAEEIIDYCALSFCRDLLSNRLKQVQTPQMSALEKMSDFLITNKLLEGGEERLSNTLVAAAESEGNTGVQTEITVSESDMAFQIAGDQMRKLKTDKGGAVASALNALDDRAREIGIQVRQALTGEILKILADGSGEYDIEFLIQLTRELREKTLKLARALEKDISAIDTENQWETLQIAYRELRDTSHEKGRFFSKWLGKSSSILTMYESWADAANAWSEGVLKKAAIRESAAVFRELADLSEKMKEEILKVLAARLAHSSRALQNAAEKVRYSGAGVGKKDYVLVENVIGPDDFPGIYASIRKKLNRRDFIDHISPKGSSMRDWGDLYASNLENLINDKLLPAIVEGLRPHIDDIDILTAIRKYSSVTSVSGWVQSAIEQCKPFCSFDTVQAGHEHLEATYVGIADDKDKAILGDVGEATIVSTGNPHEILVHSLMTRLPAFTASNMDRYKLHYEALADAAVKNPQLHLHLHRDWVSPDALPDLFPDDKGAEKE